MHESCHWFEHGDYCLHSRLPHLLVGAAGTSKEHMGAAFISAGWMFSAKEDQPRRQCESHIPLWFVWADTGIACTSRWCRLMQTSGGVVKQRIGGSLDLCRSSGLLQEPGFELHYWSCGLAGAMQPSRQSRWQWSGFGHDNVDLEVSYINEHKTERREMKLFTFVYLSCGTSW